MGIVIDIALTIHLEYPAALTVCILLHELEFHHRHPVCAFDVHFALFDCDNHRSYFCQSSAYLSEVMTSALFASFLFSDIGGTVCSQSSVGERPLR